MVDTRTRRTNPALSHVIGGLLQLHAFGTASAIRQTAAADMPAPAGVHPMPFLDSLDDPTPQPHELPDLLHSWINRSRLSHGASGGAHAAQGTGSGSDWASDDAQAGVDSNGMQRDAIQVRTAIAFTFQLRSQCRRQPSLHMAAYGLWSRSSGGVKVLHGYGY